MLKRLVPFLSRYFTCSFYPLPICHQFATVNSMRIIQPQKVKKFEAHAGFVFAKSALTPLHKPFYPAYLLSHRSAHSPPPSHRPLRLKSGRRQTEETVAPHRPQRGRCTRGGGAPRPRQAPARPACCRPTADRQRPGRGKRSSTIRGRPGEDGGANQGGGVPHPSPPPPCRTDPLAAERTAPDACGRPATPTARVYPGGARRRQRMAGRRPMGRGGGPITPPPPPAPPPS